MRYPIIFLAVISTGLLLHPEDAFAKREGGVCRAESLVSIQGSPFGLHAVGKDSSSVTDLNAGWVRHIWHWDRFEPRPGQYNGSEMDQIIQRSQEIGYRAVVTLQPESVWGGYEAGNAKRQKKKVYAPIGYPKEMNAWLKFVRGVVERYDGDGRKDMRGLKNPVTHWQIGNEPSGQWKGRPGEPDGGAASYVRFVAETAQAIRQANPRAIVVLGGVTGVNALATVDGFSSKDIFLFGNTDENVRQIRKEDAVRMPGFEAQRRRIELWLREASRYVDVIDMHSYTTDAEDLAAELCWIKAKLKEYGHQKRIWSLENAGPFFEFSPKKFSEEIVRRHFVGFSHGLERLFWSSLKPTLGWSENFLRLALIDEQGNKTPAYGTYKLMTSKLKGIRSIEVFKAPDPIKAYRVKVNKERVIIVVWSEEGEQEWTTEWRSPKATLTRIITEPGQGTPAAESVSAQNGRLVLRVSSPVFLEAGA